jgi:hypothetical protein
MCVEGNCFSAAICTAVTTLLKPQAAACSGNNIQESLERVFISRDI